MIVFNLLPWRSLQRERAKKNLIAWLVASFLIAIVIVLTGNYRIIKCRENQMLRNQILQEKIGLLDRHMKIIAQLKKAKHDLLIQRQMINEWAFTGSLTVHLLNELIRITPPGMVLTKLQRENYAVTLRGYAQSNADISGLMRNIGKNVFIHAPKLTEIKTILDAEESQDNAFTLHFLMMPNPLRPEK